MSLTDDQLKSVYGELRALEKRLGKVESFVEASPSSNVHHDDHVEVATIRDIRKNLITGMITTFGKTLAVIMGLGVLALIGAAQGWF